MTNRQDNLKFCETRHTFPCLNLQNIKTYNKIVLRIKTHTYTRTHALLHQDVESGQRKVKIMTDSQVSLTVIGKNIWASKKGHAIREKK